MVHRSGRPRALPPRGVRQEQPDQRRAAAHGRHPGRTRLTRGGPEDILLRTSEEFARLWERHEVGLRWSETRRFVHPQVGELYLYCQTLLEADQAQSLLIFTATPGTESHEKLALLTVLGTDQFAANTE